MIVKARCVLLMIALAATTDSAGQADGYDANCHPAVLPEKQAVENEFLQTHAGVRLIAAIIYKACDGVEFLRKLGERTSPTRPISNEDVFDAATPDHPDTPFARRMIDKARSAARAVFDSRSKEETFRDVFRGKDDQFGYAETTPAPGGGKRGTIIYASGTLARGQFDANNQLQGPGQLITPDRTMRAGEFKDSKLRGEGIVTGTEQGKTILIEGTFDGDQPVGEVVRTYADGSSVRERWENGRLIERGAIAAKGRIPPPLRSQPEQRLAASPTAKHGWVKVADAIGKERFELWCHGRMVDAGSWAPRGVAPRPPARNPSWQACETGIAAQPPQGNIVSNTLGSSAPTAKGPFPCPLGGARPLHEQLRACAPDPHLIMSKPVPPAFSPADRQAVASRCPELGRTGQWASFWVARGDGELMSAMYGIGTYRIIFGYPWAYIPKEKVALMSEQDVDYVSRKLLEEKQQFVKNAGNRAQLEAFGRLQACMSRYALCKAGKRAYCG